MTEKTTIENFMESVLNCMKAKNKELWSGTAGGGQSITAPGLQSYQIAQMNTTYGNFLFNPKETKITGVHSDNSNGPNDIITARVMGAISGDSISITYADYIAHNSGSNHSGRAQMKVTKIIGIIPDPKAFWKSGGGKLVNTMHQTVRGGACYA